MPTYSSQFLNPTPTSQSSGSMVNQPALPAGYYPQPELPTIPTLPDKQVVVGSSKLGNQVIDSATTGKNIINQGMVDQQANLAAKAQMTTTPEQTMKAMGYTPPTKEEIAKEMIKTLEPATPATPEQTSLDTLTTNLQTIQTDLETRWNEKQKEIESINNGTHPLTTAELAQLDDIRRSYDQMKRDQIKANEMYQGGVKASNVARGLSELAQYDAEGRMSTATNEGLEKIRAIDSEMTSKVVALTNAFRNDDIAAIKDNYEQYNKLLTARSDNISKIHDATTKFQKEQADARSQAIKDDLDILASNLSGQKFEYQQTQDEFNNSLKLAQEEHKQYQDAIDNALRQGALDLDRAKVLQDNLNKSILGDTLKSRVSQIVDDIYNGRYDREQAIAILEKEFPGIDVAQFVYSQVPDNYEKSANYKKTKDSTDAFATSNTIIQRYKDNGFTRKDIEKQYKDAGKAIPLEVQKALNDLFPI